MLTHYQIVIKGEKCLLTAADGLFHLLLPDCFSLLMLRPLAIDLLITIRYACRREVYPYLIELMKQVG